jgi:hypothetical protein
MLPPSDRSLEAFVDRRLKSLPELSAPRSLAPRILAAVAARAAVPARGWQAWPLAWRIASFASLALVFATLCLSGWHVTQSAAVTSATQEVHGFLAMLHALATAVEVILGALVRVVKELGPIWLSIFAAVFVASSLSCLGLGAALARLVWARR